MADEKLRALEKRFQETGAPEDEVAWLRERVRQGDSFSERIHFEGNPWPAGHRIEKLSWTARLDPGAGLSFHFELETADYYEDDFEEDGEEPPGGDWKAKIVWGNYHRCTLEGGFPAATEKEKLDLGALAGREFRVDTLPATGASAADLDPDGLAFETYLLGHDTVADHRIRFRAREDELTFWMSWSGRIALTYAGRDDFEHSFAIPLRRVQFLGVECPVGLGEAQARELLGRFVVGAERYELVSELSGDKLFVPRVG